MLLALGREACTSELGLDRAGVTVNPNGKISTRHDATSKAHVYALGDVVDGSTLVLELGLGLGSGLGLGLGLGCT